MRKGPGEKRPFSAGVAGGLSGAAINWAYTHIDLIAWKIAHNPNQLRYPLDSSPSLLAETLCRFGSGCLFGAIASLLPFRNNRAVFWTVVVAGVIAAAYSVGHISYFRE